jgi:hypothetical protein
MAQIIHTDQACLSSRPVVSFRVCVVRACPRGLVVVWLAAGSAAASPSRAHPHRNPNPQRPRHTHRKGSEGTHRGGAQSGGVLGGCVRCAVDDGGPCFGASPVALCLFLPCLALPGPLPSHQSTSATNTPRHNQHTCTRKHTHNAHTSTPHTAPTGTRPPLLRCPPLCSPPRCSQRGAWPRLRDARIVPLSDVAADGHADSVTPGFLTRYVHSYQTTRFALLRPPPPFVLPRSSSLLFSSLLFSSGA